MKKSHGLSHPSTYVNDEADLSNNVVMNDVPPPVQCAVSSTNLKELLEIASGQLRYSRNQLFPEVQDASPLQINTVKQELNEHNNKLSISSIAESSCKEDINIGEYNLIYLVIVEEKDSHDNDMHGLSHLSQHVNDADLSNSVVVPKCLEISTLRFLKHEWKIWNLVARAWADQ